MVNWIMICVKGPAFSVIINGSPCGFFKSNRGLRQGSPLSPYLFCIIMEFLANLTQCAASGYIPTPYHRENVRISQLLLADDAMIFACAFIPIVGNIRKFLEVLKSHAGLSINCSKSSVFHSNYDAPTQAEISTKLHIQAGDLLVKYLGMPLFSICLCTAECNPIIDKLWNKLTGWKDKNLSFAWRLELIKSTILSLHICWAMSFLLPKACIQLLDRHTRNFLWGKFDNEKCLVEQDLYSPEQRRPGSKIHRSHS